MKYLLLFLSMVMAVSGQLLFKRGINQSNLSPNIFSILHTIFIPSVLMGFVVYGLSSILWLFVLQKFPLSIAYPSLALTYVIIIILSVSFFKEPLTIAKFIGVLLIFVGVFFINK